MRSLNYKGSNADKLQCRMAAREDCVVCSCQPYQPPLVNLCHSWAPKTTPKTSPDQKEFLDWLRSSGPCLGPMQGKYPLTITLGLLILRRNSNIQICRALGCPDSYLDGFEETFSDWLEFLAQRPVEDLTEGEFGDYNGQIIRQGENGQKSCRNRG